MKATSSAIHKGLQPAVPPALPTWLKSTAARTPEKLALETSDRSWTYAQLLAEVSTLSEDLKQRGMRPGDRIGIAATRSAETVVAILAAVDAGVAYVPLDLSYPPLRLRAMVDEALPRLVLGEASALQELEGLIGAVPRLEQPSPAATPLFAAAPDLCYVLFTSGSTGKPKGVALGSQPLAHLIAYHAAHPRLGLPARTLQFAPLSFDVHFQEIFSSVACGGTLVLLPEAVRRDPEQLQAAVAKLGIERLFMPYVALQMLADAANPDELRALQDVISAGEQLQITPAIRGLFERLPDARLHNHYGPTESHVVLVHELPAKVSQWRAIPPIGQPLGHVRLALRDDQGVCHTDADTGELLLSGGCLAHGYLGAPALTAERFLDKVPDLPGRWYVTGDLVSRNAAGDFTYLGRADQQLKVDGFRIEPGEIELALMAHTSVREAVVTAPDLPGIGRQLIAHVVLREGTEIGPLRSHLRSCLPEHMVPLRFVVVPTLPLTPSGKIDRNQLPLPAASKSIPNPTATSDPRAAVRALWLELLGLDTLADDANLFDLGARSLLVLRFAARLKALGIDGLTIADIYDRPSVQGISDALRKQPLLRRASPANRQETTGVAIIGMALRTPGAPDVDAFWQQLLDGREGIRHFSPEELDASVPASLRERPNFVAARGVLEDADRFDAGFFGISGREATVLDPQQRLLLELSWNALEHASIDPWNSGSRVGVYAGTSNNSYITALREEQPALVQQYGEFATMLASEKDYVATRIAHRLNLNGPAVSIHTACSTSLVAVAQAWQALADGQCDVALAGGASVLVPQESGYLHVEGGMESADGHCRPFDTAATGTVFSSGGGMVVLKRLEDAVADGDTIHAVIRGVGLNNDGGDKASFTAPSAHGQAAAIRMALDHAQISARSIGYVEAHGTATSLGDPIEVAALTRAWQADTADTQFCGLGSVKSNLGHMAAAAGVVGLIKACLALHREQIPRTLHFRQANPQLELERTPFRVIAETTPWPRAEEPRRAAVSSFGVGGTNAHLVLEEAPSPTAPAISQPEPDAAPLYLLPLSARSPEALQRRAAELANHLEGHANSNPGEVSATLMRGRSPQSLRASVVAANLVEAVAALRSLPPAGVSALGRPRLVFLFPGQGSQHAGMARNLYDQAPAFREALDRCLACVNGISGADLKPWLIDAEPGNPGAGAQLADTRHAQPALFSMSYALASWLSSLGVKPDAMIGHSVGEYAAACLAGVMSLEDAIAAVVARGKAMAEQPRGAMLAVRAGAEQLGPMLPEGVEIAGCNAPTLTVVSGTHEAIAALAASLESQTIGTSALTVSHAFHSAMMDAALPAVQSALSRAALQAPQSPVYSCISGAPLTATEATDPAYWARQVRAPVQFSRALTSELAQTDTVFVEIGPGQALCALLRQHRNAAGGVARHVALLGSAQKPGDPAAHALQALGQLWCHGVNVAWPVPRGAKRAQLPTYPFAGERHWFKHQAVAPLTPSILTPKPEMSTPMNRLPRLELELHRIFGDVSGLSPDEISPEKTLLDQGMDSLSLTQATLEIENVFGIKLRFRRLLEDLDTVDKLVRFLDSELAPDRFAPTPVAPAAPAAVSPTMWSHPSTPMSHAMPPGGLADNAFLHQTIAQQMQLMSQQLALLGGQTAATAGHLPGPTASAHAAAGVAAGHSVTVAALPPTESSASLVEKPFGASPRLTLSAQQDFNPAQRAWLDEFIARCDAKFGKSKAFSQKNRQLMADPRVVTGFNPLWKDLVYPLVVERSKGTRMWDLDGNEMIDLLASFGANFLGYQPPDLVQAMVEQVQTGIELGPQHPLSAEVAELISDFTGMQRVAFCNTGSEAVVGALRIARTVTGRKTVAIFTNSYHGIVDEVIVRGSKQLRSLAAAPGIPSSAVEHMLVLDYASEDSLRILRERAHELAAIMIEPIQNKVPTLQPRAFVQSLREICDAAGCALIFDECVTGFRVAPGGAQEFYGIRGDIACYGKIIGGGLPLSAIAGSTHWMDALDGGHWQYGDASYPEAGVTYFAGTFVRHPLALAAAKASLLHIRRAGPALYRDMNARTQSLVDRLNTAFSERGAPVKAVHCASLWRLAWDDGQKNISLFYWLVRFHGLHLYEQFGHFLTEAMGDEDTDRIFRVFTAALDELIALGFITTRNGTPPPTGGVPVDSQKHSLEGPLTPGQTERWLAGNFDPAARRALNESLCICLAGDVDTAALELALRDVLDRHEAFRVSFDTEQPLQRLNAPKPFDIARIDLREQANAEQALDQFCRDSNGRDLPLDRAPLAAVSLLQLSDGRTVVHMVASHLIFDGWASSVFNADLAHAYRARRAGSLPTWAEAASCLVFGREEQARFAGPQGLDDLAFWQARLSNPPPPVTLGDKTPAGSRHFGADTERASIDGQVLTQLRAQAKAAGATLFQLLLTALTVVLQRQTASNDFVVSIPYAGQSLKRHGPLVGDGVLDLPMRLQCKPEDTAASLLGRVRSDLMDALDHPLMTQSAVARALGLISTGHRPPLTGLYFNLNPLVDLSAYAPLTATLNEGRKAGLLGEAFFNFYEKPEALSLDLHYSTEFFSAERARELVTAIVDECTALAHSLDNRLNQAPSEIEVDPRLLIWNTATIKPIEPHARVEQWVRRQAAICPQAVAIVVHDTSLTYSELESRATRFAHVLIARGVGPGSLVGVCLNRCLDLVPALLGILKTGAAYVPLDPGFPKERLHYMAEDANLRLVITDAVNAGLSGVARMQQLRIDDDSAVLAAAPDLPTSRKTQWPDNAPAYVIYTSGSTGKPKGVVVPQLAVCNFLASMRKQPGLRASDTLLAVTTLSFDIAVLELFLPLVTGAQVVIAQREQAMDPDALADLIGSRQVNVMQATPTTWHMLMETGWQAPAGFRALCGGEPLPPSLAKRLLAAGVELWNMYGPTETTVWSTLCQVTDPEQKISIGHPIDNTEVWVMDEQLRPCAIGQEGELCISGLGVANGYFQRPKLTAEKFVSNPYSSEPGARLYRTGDLARWSESGALEHLGRLDFQVKIRGYRIELGEIEAQLAALKGIARTVVTAREDVPGDVRLVAYAVPADGASVNPDALREALRTHLPSYMVPHHVVLIETMPLLPNGKIDRKALPSPIEKPSERSAASHSNKPKASEGVVQVVGQAMATLLKREGVAKAENFFELGGHSLLAVHLAKILSEQFGLRVTLKNIFETPTPETFATWIAQSLAETKPSFKPPILSRADQTTAPLSPMQERLWFLEMLNPGSEINHLPSAHRLRGPFNEEAFVSAFQRTVNRQSTLRTTIGRHGRNVIQRVSEEAQVVFDPLIDLSHLPADQRDAAARESIEHEVHRSFDMRTGPLFRARLYRLDAEHHVFFFMAHHLIWDGASFDLLYEEMAAHYPAVLAGRESTLPPLRISYGDFSAWMNDWLKDEELKHQVSFWQHKLTPLPPPLQMQSDRARPEVMSGRGASFIGLVTNKEIRHLEDFALAAGTTFSSAVLAAFALFLHQHSANEDFIIGMPIRGREQAELESITGFFVNALPLRFLLDASLSGQQWVQRVQATVAEALSAPDVPYEHLVQALRLPRDPSRAPVFQALYSFQDARERPTQWGALSHERFLIDLHGAAQDISLWAVRVPGGLECTWTFNTDIFDQASVAVFFAEFRQLLQSIECGASKPLATILQPRDRPTAPQRPASEASKNTLGYLRQLWTELLQRESIDPDTRFLDLGGHSLLMMRMATAIEEDLGINIKLKDIFENETARALALWIDSRPDDELPAAAVPQTTIAPKIDRSRAPPTLMQQRVWFVEQMQPGTATYHIPSAVRLTGALDTMALSQALNLLIARHEALRTWIENDPEGEPVQRILDTLTVASLALEDLSESASRAREKRLLERLDALVETPFDLSKPPLFRANLFRMGAEEHVLCFVFHHLISDGWSVQLAWRDLDELYRSIRHSDATSLPSLDITYGDYANAHRQKIAMGRLQEQVQYWQEQLTPLPDPLSLPEDFARPAFPTHRAGHTLIEVPSATKAAMLAQAKESGTTLFMVTLAAYLVFLVRHTNQDDFVVGMPTLGRDESKLENVFGFFSNILPLRLSPVSTWTFVEVLTHVQNTVIAGLGHPEVPLEQVLRDMKVERDESRSPVYQTAFGYQEVMRDETRLFETTREPIYCGIKGIAEDLTIWMWNEESGLKGHLTFAMDLFSEETAQRFADRLVHLMASVCEHRNLPIAAIPLIHDDERLVLDGWNANVSTYNADATIHGLVSSQAEKTPGASAVLQPSLESCTYAALESRSNRLAHTLRSRGVGRGDMVGLCLERSLEMIVAQLAILKSGAAYVPLDPGYPEDRLTYMGEDAQFKLLVTSSALQSSLVWPQSKSLLLDVDAAAIESSPETKLPEDPLRDAQPQDPAYVIYTSGSTGKPKGVVVHHRAVVNFLTSMACEPGLKPGDTLLAVTTLSFDIAVLELLLPLTVGASVVLATREQALDGHAMRKLIEGAGVNVMQATPSTWRMLIESGWAGSSDFKALIGGEALPLDLATELLARTGELWNMYGPTETTVWSACWRVPNPHQGIFIGKPIANTAIHVLDERLQPCPIGVSGEIYIGGDGVTLGYLHRVELTNERFVVDPFSPNVAGARLYRTGDRGRWRNNGLLEHQGRLDFQVKVRGYRIELGEIEAALSVHRKVSRSLVVVREDVPGDQRLVAYVVPANGLPDTQELREHLRTTLPAYMVPQQIVLLDQLPLLPNGKIDRASLPIPSGTAPTPTRASRPPRTGLETQLALAMASALNLKAVNIDDNFFDLGGHSMLALRLVGQINRELGLTVSLRTLLESPTVEKLAASLEEPNKAQTTLIQLRPGAGRPGIFFIHDVDGEVLLYRNLAMRLDARHPVYALQPHGDGEHPMLHTRISEMTDHYVRQIQSVQPRGPYILAGLCAGGEIAFEIACRLQAQGERIATLALFDATHPDATFRRKFLSQSRIDGLNLALSEASKTGNVLIRTVQATTAIFRKIVSAVEYELSTRSTRVRLNAKLRKLRASIDKGAQLSPELRQLTVRQIISFAQRTERKRNRFVGNALLLRATHGDGTQGDAPFVDLYSDPLFGWSSGVEGKVIAADVEGGHSSMLQEPFVASTQRIFQESIDAALSEMEGESPRRASIAGATSGLRADGALKERNQPAPAEHIRQTTS